jgi:DNA-binding Lrp family transcriptional regulator
MDERDHALISLLERNAREPVSSLARKLGLSRSTVQDRIDKLESTGVITGYTVRTGTSFRNRRLTAYVMLEVDPKHADRIIKSMEGIRAVSRLRAVTGIYDLVATVRADTPEEIDMAFEQIRRIPGITADSSSIVLSTKFDR